jgi:O-antigen ligase
MKSKAIPRSKKTGVSLFEIIFPVLPAIALIPNTFIAPPLGHEGLATQEFIFAMAIVIFAGIGLAQFLKSRRERQNAGAKNANEDTGEVNREELLAFAALAIFILWRLISISWAPTPYSGVRVTGIWLGFATFFAAGIFSLRERSAEWLLHGLSFVAAALGASIVYERLVFGVDMRGIFFNHGISAELLVILLPFQILRYLTSENLSRAIVSLFVLGLTAVALLMGLRRGALMASVFILIAVGLGLAFKIIKSQNKARTWIAVALIVLAAGAVGARYREQIVERIQGATRLQSDEGGLTTRLRSWVTAWEMGKSHALIGVGEGGYPSLYGEYRKLFVSNPNYSKIAQTAGPEDNDEIRSPLVHNEYLETFVELGIVGFALFLTFWILVARLLWRRLRQSSSPNALGALIALGAFAISSFTSGFSLRYTPQAIILACALCVGFASSRVKVEAADRRAAEPFLNKLSLAIIALSLIAGVTFTARTFNVLASQRLQGGVNRPEEAVDFQFYPNNEAGNEALRRRYERVIALDSENVGAQLGYAILLFNMKKPDLAIPHVEFALKHGYSRPFAYVLLAFALEQSGDRTRAEQVLSDCLASYPQSVYTRAAYAEILRKQGKTEQAKEQQNIAIQHGGNDAASWELVMKMKIEDAVAEANRRGLPPPNGLMPGLAKALVLARAYQYLK